VVTRHLPLGSRLRVQHQGPDPKTSNHYLNLGQSASGRSACLPAVRSSFPCVECLTPIPCLTAGNSQTEKMLAQLEAKAAEMQAIYERAQQELQEQWEGYRGLYEKACTMQQVRSSFASRRLRVGFAVLLSGAVMSSHRLNSRWCRSLGSAQLVGLPFLARPLLPVSRLAQLVLWTDRYLITPICCCH
jgi:hypothetical protein